MYTISGAWSTTITSPVGSNLNRTVMPRMRKETSLLDGSAVSPECLLQSRFEHWACVSAEVLPDAADHMRDLKQPNRLVIIANHNGGCIVKGGLQMTVSLTERSPDCLAAHQPLFHCKAPTGLSRPSQNVLTVFLIHSWREFWSVGKQNTETRCCLWVKLVNVNHVAWVQLFGKAMKTKMLLHFNIGLTSWAIWTCVTIDTCRTKLYKGLKRERAVFRDGHTYTDKMLDFMKCILAHSSSLHLGCITFLGSVCFLPPELWHKFKEAIMRKRCVDALHSEQQRNKHAGCFLT